MGEPTPLVVVGVVLFGTKYLAQSLSSLQSTTYPNLRIYLHDQEEGVYGASAYIKEQLPHVIADPRVVLTQGKNLWHSGGHNTLIRRAIVDQAAYYVVASNDMWYEPNTVSALITAVAADKAYGSAAPRLRRWDYTRAVQGDVAGSKTQVIDSLGIGLTAGHHFFDIAQGLSDSSAYAEPQTIFGPSGALAAYRIAALQEIGVQNAMGDIEYFDEALHYKNDVDLAYRLAWAGFECMYAPMAIAYHDRQLGGGEGLLARLTARNKVPLWARVSSFVGHVITVRKNFSPEFSWYVRVRTFLENLKRTLYVLLCEREVWQEFRKREKQFAIASSKKIVPPGEIEKLMS